MAGPSTRLIPADVTAESATWVIIDDTSSDINYIGNWAQTTATPQLNSIGYFGPTFLDTLHTITGQGSLTYTFQGTAVELYGSAIIKRGDRLPKMNCIVDGVNHSPNREGWESNHYPFCQILDMEDGQHTLNFTVEIPSSQNISIDKVAYIPSPSADLSHALLQVDESDFSIKYDPYWQDIVAARWTYSNGSRAIIEFTGTSLSWYAMSFEQDINCTEARATYTLDDDPEEHTIVIPVRRKDPAVFLNEQVFTLTDLEPKRHQLNITYRSNSTSRPLYLDYLLIQRAPDNDLPPTTTSGAPGATTAGDQASTSSNGNPHYHSFATWTDTFDFRYITGNSDGLSSSAEIGIGIGAAILLISLVFFFYRRYKHRAQNQEDASGVNGPQMTAQSNFPSRGGGGVSFPTPNGSHVTPFILHSQRSRSSSEPINAVAPTNPVSNEPQHVTHLEGPHSPVFSEELPRYSIHIPQ
ncbi:hypothetical protein CVT24_006021 [Panaeolus cyanescens]|uniref:Uncharacterized protein n=1 Tax=Panaeolus cyanescens TaxID=181874 RepID=A0A409YE36_9AGAR|nr:hypothetical protein CVT24_006021 [Panaeolus cyanescens]